MKVSVLIKNKKDNSKNLLCEAGLSIYIEFNNKRILFDTGRTDTFIKNASKMGINLNLIDGVVISHGHGDHGGGLLSFLEINNKAKVYAKSLIDGDFYFRTMLFRKNVSINKEVFNKYSYRINYVNRFTEIMNNVYIITDIEKTYETPKGNKYLYVKNKNKLVRDKFQHELIMVIREKDELTIFTGCSHHGTVNMIETVKNMFPKLKIKAVVGGFHLVKIPLIKHLSSSKKEINMLANKILYEKIEKVYTGHCTGEKAFEKLHNVLGDKIVYISTGTQFNI